MATTVTGWEEDAKLIQVILRVTPYGHRIVQSFGRLLVIWTGAKSLFEKR